jgi:hypothetical protein
MLRESYKVKVVRDNNDLELIADANESILVLDVMIDNPANDYVSLFVENTRVGYFRVGGELGNNLPNMPGGTVEAIDNDYGIQPSQKTLLGLLRDRGLFNGYPVPEGRSFSITGASQADAVQIVVYQTYDAGDITPDMQNGEEWNEMVWVNYGSSGAVIGTAGDTEYDTPTNPASFNDFPFGQSAPDNRTTEVLGILASDFAPTANDGTDDISTAFLKLTKETTVLFDEDNNGLLLDASEFQVALTEDHVGEGVSVIGSYSDTDGRPPLMFDNPLVFEGGDRLTVEMTTEVAGTGQDISVAEQEVGFILRTTRG